MLVKKNESQFDLLIDEINRLNREKKSFTLKSETSLLELTQHIDNYPLFYWQAKESSKEYLFLGIDELLKNTTIEQINIPYLIGGQLFLNLKDEKHWDNFRDLSFYIPQIVLIKEDNKLKIHAVSQYKINYKKRNNQKFQIKENSTYEIPEFDHWVSLINKATETIKHGNLQKVVLSKKITINTEEENSYKDLIFQLKNKSRNEYKLLWALSNSECFVCISPERLFKIDHNRVYIDSLAGTTTRGEDNQTDEILGNQLLSSKKNLKEHRFVTKMIQETLSIFCSSTAIFKNESLLKLSHIQHIHSIIEGNLKNETSIFDLLNALHPTPAVGGLPQTKAQNFIIDNENFERGLYSAPTGIIGPEDAEFLVGIRCAHYHQKQVDIYGGVGIVEESKANEEWLEANEKMKNFTDIL